MKKEEAIQQIPLLLEMEQILLDYQQLLQEALTELEKIDPSSE